MKRVGISLVGPYDRVGKSVIWVCERDKGLTDEFYSVIDSYLKDSAFTAVKRDTKF